MLLFIDKPPMFGPCKLLDIELEMVNFFNISVSHPRI